MLVATYVTSLFNVLLAPALLVALALTPLLLFAVLLTLWRRFVRSRNRRSPLTSDLLRTPGFGLQERIEELTLDFDIDFAALMWIPLLFFGVYQIRAHATAHSQLFVPLFVLMGAGMLVFFTSKLIDTADRRQRYKEAYQGELATAQLLEPIIANGGRLFHDVQAKGFNIDHVVVAPRGVFAVETKHRLKPTKGNAHEQARVAFDGKALHFPGWVETKPIEQARAQARWLSERLTKATGLTVRARPVVALPGWYVTCTAPSDVAVVNPKNWNFMLRPARDEPALEPAAIQRIAYQLEQLCQLPPPEQRKFVSSRRTG